VIHSGGGVAGVTMALALSRFPNIEVDIYEAAGKFGEIGAGLLIWYRTWTLLMKYGLQDLEKVVSFVPLDKQGISCVLN
jgi:salicylate hydroxylase